MYPATIAFLIIIAVSTSAVAFRKQNNRFVGILHGVFLQMVVVIPIVVIQLTGFVWPHWSIDPSEAMMVSGLSTLFDMAGGTVYTLFEWLVPKRQTWVFSNLPEFAMLWISKVMFVACVYAWRRERNPNLYDWFKVLLIIALFIDAWFGRTFPWWGS